MAPKVASTLQIIPDELSFPFELETVATSKLTLYNTSVNKIAYRIKTTNPMRYGVQPSSGFVEAGSTTATLVILQKHQGYPLDLADCKDKFLVLWVSVQPQAHKVTSTMFDPLVGGAIHAERLCVRFTAAADSLATTATTKPSRWKLLSLKSLFQSFNHSADNTNLQQQQITDLQEQKALLAQDKGQQAQAYQNKHPQLTIRFCGLSAQMPALSTYRDLHLHRAWTELGPSVAASSVCTLNPSVTTGFG